MLSVERKKFSELVNALYIGALVIDGLSSVVCVVECWSVVWGSVSSILSVLDGVLVRGSSL